MRWTDITDWKSSRLQRNGRSLLSAPLLCKHSIRTKLLISVITLSAMSVILALTGLIGFYRYKSLADAISIRATELPLATSLSREAASAESANHRLCRHFSQSHQGMIDSSVLADSVIKLEKSQFDQTMVNLSLIVDQYADRIGLPTTPCPCVPSLVDQSTPTYLSSSGVGGVLIDPEQQRESLAKIQSTIKQIECLRLDPRSMINLAGSDANDISAPLRDLVTLTHEHLALMHSQMASFSDHVKGQHRAGFTIACVVLVIAMAATAFMVWFFRNTVIKPFRTLVDGSRLIAAGHFQHHITLGTGDELSELAEVINDMTTRFREANEATNQLCRDLDQQVKQRSREVIRNEQLAGVGFLAAGFAHEINNPMATIAWSAEALESRLSELLMVSPQQRLLDEEMTTTLQENLQRIQGEAFRCKSITEKMLSFSRLGNVQRSAIDLVPLVNDVAEMVGTVGKYRCKSLRVIANPETEGKTVPVIAHANSPEIRQVVLNLITNAMECVAEDGRVEVDVFCDEKAAVVRVRDNGCGMSEEVRAHVFEPFFTRRRDGTGTGLGLSISSRIVSQHGGSLEADSPGEGLGSEFTLRLPRQPVTHDEISSHSQSPFSLFPIVQSAWREKHAQVAEAA